MSYPNEQLWAGRPPRQAPAHDAMTANGARRGCSWGLEAPIYFAPEGFEEIPTLKRSNAHDIVGEECRRTRAGVGVIDISGFSRFEVTGPESQAWLDRAGGAGDRALHPYRRRRAGGAGGRALALRPGGRADAGVRVSQAM